MVDGNRVPLRRCAERRTASQREDDKPPLWRRMLSWAFTLMIVATTIFLWPASLGGSTRLVIVSGTSMEPTYDLGDMVITRDSGTSALGDTVVFEIPEGTAAGSLVIHRIVDVDDEGRFITQGDNRATADIWPLTESDVVGQPLLHVPKGGLFVRFLQQWWVISILVGVLVVFVLWPSADEDEDGDDDDTDEDAAVALAVTVGAPAVGATAVADRPSEQPDEFDWEQVDLTLGVDTTELIRHDLELDERDDILRTDSRTDLEIDQAVMDEAMDWLETQLAEAASAPAG